MSDICGNWINYHPTEVKIKITQNTNCSFSVEDVSDDCYLPPTHFGFHPEIPEEDYDLPNDQFRRSWGYFVNVIYWNKYNSTHNVCEAIKQSTSLVFENGSTINDTGFTKEYTLNRDGWFTVYRMFVLKKEVFEEILDQYVDYTAIVQEQDEAGNISLYTAEGWTIGEEIVYTPVTDITDVVKLFDNQQSNLHILGSQCKEELVSTCFLKTCLDSISKMLMDQIVNPCLSGFTSSSSKNLFGIKSSTNCASIFNNPLFTKRDLLWLIITTIKIYVSDCEYCKAEKLIEQIMGSSTNSDCNQFYFLCGDTKDYKTLSSNCGCA